MIRKRIRALILSILVILSVLPANLAFAEDIDSEKAKRALHVYAQPEQSEPLKIGDEKTVSYVNVGEQFNLYLSIDNPNKGVYDDTIADTPEILAEVEAAKAEVEANFKADTKQYEKLEEEAKTSLSKEANKEALKVSTDKTSQEYVDAYNKYIADNPDYVENYLANILKARQSRAENLVRQFRYHKERRYDLNGYEVKIYYKEGELIPKLPGTENINQNTQIIDYTIPDKYDLTNPEYGITYRVENYSLTDVTRPDGQTWKCADLWVFFEGDFLPQTPDDKNWYNLLTIPFTAETTGSKRVFCEVGVLYNKREEGYDNFVQFEKSVYNGGYHTIHVENQTQPSPPVADPASKNDTESFFVTLTASPDCNIIYSTDGGVTEKTYTEPIKITESTKITCWAVKKNDTTAVSNRVEYEYKIVPEKPLLFEKDGDAYKLIQNAYYKTEDFEVNAYNKPTFDGTFAEDDKYVDIYYTYSDILAEDFEEGKTTPKTDWVKLDKANLNVIPVTENKTIRLIAVRNGNIGYEISDVSVYHVGKRPLPVKAQPESGADVGTVTLIPQTTGSDIYYTLDGTDPRTGGTKYTAPIAITKATLIRATAKLDGVYSETKDFNYTVTNPKDDGIIAIDPPGEYEGSAKVSLSPNNSEYTVQYWDGSKWVDHTEPLVITDDTTVTARVVDKDGVQQGVPSTFEYRIKPLPPVFAPESTTFLSVDKVTILSPESNKDDADNYTLYYTTDGSDPKGANGIAAPDVDIAVIPIVERTEISAAIVKDVNGNKVWSDVVTHVYNVIPNKPAQPQVTLEPGYYTGNDVKTQFAKENDDVEIYYTISNGNDFEFDPDVDEYKKDPATSKTKLYTPDTDIELNGRMIIKAIAVNKNTGAKSEVAVFKYIVVPGVSVPESEKVPAPIITLPSGRYSTTVNTIVKMPDNMPAGDYSLYYSQGDETEWFTNGKERTFTINESKSVRAYIKDNKTGKVSETVVRYYIIESGVIASGNIYSSFYTHIVLNGETERISSHNLVLDGYNKGIKLHTPQKNVYISYQYTIIDEDNNIVKYIPSGYFEDLKPIRVTTDMKKVTITATLKNVDDSPVDGVAEHTFTYVFVDVPVPETNLYVADPLKTEYPSGTTVEFTFDYTADANKNRVLYYTTDESDPAAIGTREVYDGVDDDIKINATPTVIKAVIFEGCGECSDCTGRHPENCKQGVYGETRTFRYTIPTTVSSGGGSSNSGSGGGGGSFSSTAKYTKDIFGNEHPTHISYINGYPDGSVKPNGNITREEIASILYRIKNKSYESPFVSTGEVFPDVKLDRWSVTEIEYMTARDVIIGYPDGEFKPTGNLTRAEFAALIYRFTGLDEAVSENPFPDLSEEHWSYNESLALYEADLLQGYEDGTIRPENKITRAEVMTVINKILGRKPLESYVKTLNFNPFTDLNEGEWFYVTVLEATITHDYTLDKSGYEYKWEVKKHY